MAVRRNIGEVDLAAGSTIAGGAIGGGLDEPAHDALDHTGLTGVPAAEAFTSGVHASTDHTGIAGVDAETESVTVGTGVSQTRTIPGGTLAVNNERLEFKIWGVAGGSGDSIAVTFGGLSILTLNPGISDPWAITGTIIRTGATAQEISVDGSADGVGAQHNRTVGTATLANPNDLVATASSGGTPGDVFALIVSKWAA